MSSYLLVGRQRKDELEQRMSALQESRRELMVQLEGLMKLLKVRTRPVCSVCTVSLTKQPGAVGPRKFSGQSG